MATTTHGYNNTWLQQHAATATQFWQIICMSASHGKTARWACTHPGKMARWACTHPLDDLLDGGHVDVLGLLQDLGLIHLENVDPALTQLNHDHMWLCGLNHLQPHNTL